MKKNSLKYFVDTLLFIDKSSIAILGLLLGFVIPKGREGVSGNFFLWLHRHQWVDIHLFLSLVLLVLLGFHLWFNRTWIVQTVKMYCGEHSKNSFGSFHRPGSLCCFSGG
ncbi:MAG: DUF4405 domain-containing protein [Proteobacteria bacterium]|nr:DUF4405 domain-containing protein [Pseudomonadota bacterium]